MPTLLTLLDLYPTLSLTGETTSSDAPEASSLSPSEPICGCSWTTPTPKRH